ncbi:MAG TPA: prephenate dehydrogenase/arogenate dehydrogenase family protein [Firmicutes bacterium]|nr:prephenate dehydrogenase/arogenate dehydrogenase family protein [Bacillota bacterium]
MLKPKRAAIIGLGIIGGSLAWSLRRAGWEVRAYDRDRNCLQYARERKIIDAGYNELAPVVTGASLICLAVPPAEILALGREMAPHLAPGCLVTDVASVKEKIVAGLMAVLPPSVYYVGGHPMVGSEQRGIRAASPYLLVGAPYILTPVPATSSEALDFMVELVKSLRGRPLLMPPAEHDYWVAASSHVPYLAAVALCQLVARLGGDMDVPASLAAGGLRDVTRVASSDPLLWQDICLGNREQILPLLRIYRGIIAELEGLLERGDLEALVRFFAGGKGFRDALLAGGRTEGDGEPRGGPAAGEDQDSGW